MKDDKRIQDFVRELGLLCVKHKVHWLASAAAPHMARVCFEEEKSSCLVQVNVEDGNLETTYKVVGPAVEVITKIHEN